MLAINWKVLERQLDKTNIVTVKGYLFLAKVDTVIQTETLPFIAAIFWFQHN
jgi:hypothetical protein